MYYSCCCEASNAEINCLLDKPLSEKIIIEQQIIRDKDEAGPLST